MEILYVSGSPRKKSNTDHLLRLALSVTGGRLIKLTDYRIAPCKSCRLCQKSGECVIQDDMSDVLMPLLLQSDAIILGSPIFFNNVSAQLKSFMDRTWCIRGELRNKIGGAIVVGRRYGAESAITAMNSFFLKHEMIPANRGVCGMAFAAGEIADDAEAIRSTKKLGERILELCAILGHSQ